MLINRRSSVSKLYLSDTLSDTFITEHTLSTLTKLTINYR